MVEAYCIKCKKNVEMQNPRKITTKNQRSMALGTCPNCGTNVSRILGGIRKPKTLPIKRVTVVEPKFRPPEVKIIRTDMVGADQFYNELARQGQRAGEAERVAVAESLEKQKIYVAYSIEKKRADDLSAYRDRLVTAHNELYTRLYERDSEIMILTEQKLIAERTVDMQRAVIDKILQQLKAVLPGREFQKYEGRIMELLRASFAMQAPRAERSVEAEKEVAVT